MPRVTYAATTADPWDGWATAWTAGTSATTWEVWYDEASRTWCHGPARPMALDDAQLAELQRQQAELQRQQAAARATAEALLLSHLTPGQRAEYGRAKRFVVDGSAGGLYRLAPPATVRRLGREKKAVVEVEHLCAHPDLAYPAGDVLLTQKLWLEHDEPGFRAVANITQLRPAA